MVALGVIAVFAHGPIPQDPAYHRFVDTRALFGIPNALNVLSNLPFLAVGLLGFRALIRRGAAVGDPWERRAFFVLFAGITLTAFGSAYYHWAPDDARLVWDRLPMTVVFGPLFALVLGERLGAAWGRLLWPLVVLGVVSVMVWRLTDDLRLYALVQFVPLALLPLLLLLYPPKYSHQGELWAMIAWYVGAKLLELLDVQIWSLGQLVSGHTLKHLAAGAAVFHVVRWVERRDRLARAARRGAASCRGTPEQRVYRPRFAPRLIILGAGGRGGLPPPNLFMPNAGLPVGPWLWGALASWACSASVLAAALLSEASGALSFFGIGFIPRVNGFSHQKPSKSWARRPPLR